MDSWIFGHPYYVDTFIGVKPHPVDTLLKTFVVSCIHKQGLWKGSATYVKELFYR